MSPKVVAGFFLIWMSLIAYSQNRNEKVSDQYDQALEYYHQKDYESALQILHELVRSSKDPVHHYLYGLVLESTGGDIRAIGAYENTLKLLPDFHEARFQKAVLYLNHGDPEQAIKDLSYLIENQNTFHETRGIIFQIDPAGAQQNKVLTIETLGAGLYHYRGQAYQKKKDYVRARSDLNQAISIDPQPEYYVSSALLHLATSDRQAAIVDLKAALAIDSLSHLAWYNLALIDETIEIPGGLLAEEAFSPTLGLLASRSMESGQYEQARAYFDKAITRNPDDPLALINRGRALLKLKEYSSARGDFYRARVLDPARIETLYLIGNSYFFEKQFTQALAFYDTYLGIDPVNEMIWYNAAMCHLELGTKSEACYYLDRSLEFGLVEAGQMLRRYCKEE